MIGKCKWQFKCNLSSQHDPSSRGGGAAALGTAAARPKRSRAGPGPPGCSAPRSAAGNTAGEHHHLPASLTHFSETGVQLQGSTSSPARPREAAGHRQAAQPGTASALQLRRDLRVPDRPVPPRCSALCGCERGRRWSSSVGLRSVALHSGVRRCSECSWSPSQPGKASTHPHADFGLSPCSPPSHWPRICVQTQSSEHSTAAHSSSTAAAALSPPCRAALTVAQPRVLGSSHGAPNQRTGPGQSTAIAVCPQALPHRAVPKDPLLPSHWCTFMGGCLAGAGSTAETCSTPISLHSHPTLIPQGAGCWPVFSIRNKALHPPEMLWKDRLVQASRRTAMPTATATQERGSSLQHSALPQGWQLQHSAAAQWSP